MCDCIEATDIFVKTFNILRSNPRVVLPLLAFTLIIGGITLYYVFSLLNGPYGVNGVALGHHIKTNSSYLSTLIPFFEKIVMFILLLILVSFFITPLLTGFYISVANQGYIKSRISTGTAFSFAKKAYLTLLATELIIYAIWIAAIAILALIFILPVGYFGRGIGTIIWLLLGGIISLIILIFLGVLLYEAYPIAAMERVGAIGAIKRSVDVGWRKIREIFVVFLVTAAILIGYITILGLLQTTLEFLASTYGVLSIGIIIAQTINFILGSGLNSWFLMVPVGFYKGYVEAGVGNKPKNIKAE